jgi:hypothetical protein
MPGGGYIFSTSNCIYTGMPLASYERMLDVWKEEGKTSETTCLEDGSTRIIRRFHDIQ